MRFTETSLPGVYLVDIEPIADERGFFSRIWCQQEFDTHGLDSVTAQSSISFNRRRGTVRGMHYQVAPHQEAKLVRCIAGSLLDVVMDLRPGTPTYGRWLSTELTSINRRSLFIPQGLAHGFQTLEDNTEVLYCISHAFHPGSSRGIRWDDPAFSIDWPIRSGIIISGKDSTYPDHIL